jgi:hypothetical protein
MNMVLDQSGSMSDSCKMDQAKDAAHIFLREVINIGNNRVEITSFDDDVYLRREFTDDYDLLSSAVDFLSPMGGTALYDALYSALLRTNDQTGARCVVAFTDGLENSSRYNYDDVIRLSALTGIPVYLIGVGRDIDERELNALAIDTGGRYYNADTTNLSAALSGIYQDIYEYQHSMYAVRYTSSFTNLREQFRTVELKSKPTAGYAGVADREYTPNASESIEDERSAAEDLIIVAPPEPADLQLFFNSASASSTRHPYKDISYGALNAIDGDLNTAWVEGPSGPGIGEFIILSADRTQTLSEIHIWNGYFKSEDLYYKNNSIKTLRVSLNEFGSGSPWESFEVELRQDPSGPQIIKLDRPRQVKLVELTILDVYLGSADSEDTCISEVEFY